MRINISTYRQTAAKLNIQLAADCPDNDKAFTDETWGTILGIIFDSQLMAWRMPAHKVQELLEAAGNFIAAGMVVPGGRSEDSGLGQPSVADVAIPESVQAAIE
jgi:hypothetical protein